MNSSEKERNAAEVERAVDDYYKTLYISDYVGETFDGVVSGVTGFGVFVEQPQPYGVCTDVAVFVGDVATHRNLARRAPGVVAHR